jgi:hypothetical protein
VLPRNDAHCQQPTNYEYEKAIRGPRRRKRFHGRLPSARLVVELAGFGLPAVILAGDQLDAVIEMEESAGGRPWSAFVTERVHLVFSFPYWRFGLKAD